MNRIIITGGPGFGKSSIIRELERRAYFVFHEISREILEHEKQTGGTRLPWIDHHAFNAAIFEGRVRQYQHATDPNRVYFYDRGVPDSLAYLMADEKEVPDDFMETAKTCRYFKTIFITPPWDEIYHQDKQRWEEFRYAEKIHLNLEKFYSALGYELFVLPKLPIQERVDLILSHLKQDIPNLLMAH